MVLLAYEDGGSGMCKSLDFCAVGMQAPIYLQAYVVCAKDRHHSRENKY